ncbi:proline dehydrogenase family protein [Myroides odoratimimus]|uniref:proline dehydrogenase family protein n=1 Tax=Myroides odoratimimus TaxID=76832 RepID=UPI0025764032|nr:proline dehydrogenase family protein [Myroides odoratimimus]MDM1098047.1 proline dehydrogenase family protein [Myroides odoratimimus]MDM1328586.1 proline dehydrogenase family protein [Myroides odoratimimus]MDM1443015.1 proline dehydrogenase family protein [Myroides odoratimimus]MDM1448467.1 proline dehydrogenase family protein [Myroides odoratimimus]MDM1453553.1 proline dehydrogenase family protein [Myroides odoratimimus]
MKNLFNNTEVAFALKNNKELKRAHFLFKMISKPTLVKLGSSLANFAIKTHLPVTGLIRSTVFDHFCGGISEDDCLTVVDNMYAKGGVASVLDYSVEGKETEKQFDAALNMTIKTIEYAKQRPDSIPFAVFKPTGFGRFDMFVKKGEKVAFTAEEEKEWERIVYRFNMACKFAYDNDVLLLIDAEHSWMQDAADDICLDMMRKYNKEKALIYNTAQMYRWDRLQYLKDLHAIAKEEGFHVGMKVVRGAYMEVERERATERGYKSPICVDKAATDVNYDAGVTYMLENIDSMAIFAGTHNEKSSYLIMDLMEKHGISHTDRRLYFGQLYGMSDNISFNLAKEKFNVAKYLPFGPVRDVIPYLIRRAEENTSVAGQTNRELDLIETELKRRKL